MTDNDKAERVLERLLAVKWEDYDGALRHRGSRIRLMQEYLRRTAQWAQVLGTPTPNRWPIVDLAKTVDPTKEADPAQLEELLRSAKDFFYVEVLPRAAENALHWAALGDLPAQRFPEMDDPFEPLLLLLERGGGFRIHSGFMELEDASLPYKSVAERGAQEPLAIDEATLDALDLTRGGR
jgi:hypothetical protein